MALDIWLKLDGFSRACDSPLLDGQGCDGHRLVWLGFSTMISTLISALTVATSTVTTTAASTATVSTTTVSTATVPTTVSTSTISYTTVSTVSTFAVRHSLCQDFAQIHEQTREPETS